MTPEIINLIIKPYQDKISSLETQLLTYKKLGEDTCRYSSPELDKLFTALGKAQGNYPHITCNRENNHYKKPYADYDSIMKAVLPILSENGLALTHDLKMGESGETILHTILGHSSGQWKESRSRIVTAKGDMFSINSAINDLKRQAAMAILGISIHNDPADDDGVVAQQPINEEFKQGTSITHNYKSKSPKDLIVKEQIEELEYECQGYPDIMEDILTKNKIASISDLPKERYRHVRETIMTIVDHRKNGPRPTNRS